MKALKSLLLIFLLNFSLYAKEDIVLGLLYGKLFFSEKEARIGANLWVKSMEKGNFDRNIKIAFYTDTNEILNDFQNKKITTIVTTGPFYYENKEFLDKFSQYKWIISRDENKELEYYLIVNNEENYDFDKNKKMQVLYKYDFEKYWAQSLIFDKKLKADNYSFIRKDSEKAVVYESFFTKDILSVVPKDLYEMMVSLNPQIKEKTKILAKSDSIFFRAMGFTRTDLSKEILDTYIDITNKINDDKVDFGVLSFVQIQKVFVLDKNEMEKLDQFMEKYKGIIE